MKPALASTAAFLLLASSPCCAADRPASDNESQLRGASSMALMGKGDAVHRTLQFCSERYPAIALRAELVEAGWKERNGRYLALLPTLEKESLLDAIDNGRQQKWLDYQKEARPKLLEHVREMFVNQIQDSPESVRERMCDKFANDFAAGRFDFAADHQLIDYLNRRLGAAK